MVAKSPFSQIHLLPVFHTVFHCSFLAKTLLVLTIAASLTKLCCADSCQLRRLLLDRLIGRF